MQIGQDFYCDNCRVEISSAAAKCKGCDPVNGVEERIYIFTMQVLPEKIVIIAPFGTVELENKPFEPSVWWKFWQRGMVSHLVLFVALNVAIWGRDLQRINDVSRELGRRGYMGCPLYAVAGRFPSLWGLKRIGDE